MLAVLFLWVVVARFVYRVDSEWMTGSVRESVERVRDGRQIYVAPSQSFVPFVYTPLYVWVSAALAPFCSVFVACKLVSLAATAVTAWGIGQPERSAFRHHRDFLRVDRRRRLTTEIVDRKWDPQRPAVTGGRWGLAMKAAAVSSAACALR